MDEKLANRVCELLSEKSGVEVRLIRVVKRGLTCTGFEFLHSSNVHPVLYLPENLSIRLDVFSEQDALRIADVIFDIYQQADPSLCDTDIERLFSSKEWILSRVRRVLCSTCNNEEFLSSVIHRDFLDMSVYYRIVIKEDEDGLASVALPMDLAAGLNISIQELEDASRKNAPPESYVTLSMREVLHDAMPDRYDLETERDDIDSVSMYVVTDKFKSDGSTALLESFVFRALSKELKDDLYLLPSSVHEIIVLPVSDAGPELCKELVTAVNSTEVDAVDFLSNSVYKYLRKYDRVIRVM